MDHIGQCIRWHFLDVYIILNVHDFETNFDLMGFRNKNLLSDQNFYIQFQVV